MRSHIAIAFALVSCLAASSAEAQGTAWRELSVSAARIDYDLSGVGNAPGLAVRTSRQLFGNVHLDLRGSFAKPDQQFGPSTLFLPEAQIHYRWALGRVLPYVGGGLGAAMVRSPFHTDWDPTLSVSAGTGVRLTDRFGLTGELRVRGHEWRFTGTTAELSVGAVWLLGSF